MASEFKFLTQKSYLANEALWRLDNLLVAKLGWARRGSNLSPWPSAYTEVADVPTGTYVAWRNPSTADVRLEVLATLDTSGDPDVITFKFSPVVSTSSGWNDDDEDFGSNPSTSVTREMKFKNAASSTVTWAANDSVIIGWTEWTSNNHVFYCGQYERFEASDVDVYPIAMWNGERGHTDIQDTWVKLYAGDLDVTLEAGFVTILGNKADDTLDPLTGSNGQSTVSTLPIHVSALLFFNEDSKRENAGRLIGLYLCSSTAAKTLFGDDNDIIAADGLAQVWEAGKVPF